MSFKKKLKNMMGWNSKPEIFHEDKTHESQKKTSQNNFFIILFVVKIQFDFLQFFFSKFYERDLSKTQLIRK